jgi:hypothetical protein
LIQVSCAIDWLIEQTQLFETLRNPETETATLRAKEIEDREKAYLLKAQQRLGDLVWKDRYSKGALAYKK